MAISNKACSCVCLALFLHAAVAKTYEYTECKFSVGSEEKAYGCVPAKFGNDFNFDGTLAVTEPLDGCSTPTSDVKGKIAFVMRGTCGFTTKVATMEKAGAVGVVVGNNDKADPFFMAFNHEEIVGGAAPQIGSVMIGKKDAEKITSYPSGTVISVSVQGKTLEEISKAENDSILFLENSEKLYEFISYAPKQWSIGMFFKDRPSVKDVTSQSFVSGEQYQNVNGATTVKTMRLPYGRILSEQTTEDFGFLVGSLPVKALFFYDRHTEIVHIFKVQYTEDNVTIKITDAATMAQSGLLLGTYDKIHGWKPATPTKESSEEL